MAMIQTIGSSRVMFGSDSLLNMAAGKAVFDALPLNESQKADVFGLTAVEAFGLE
jgi:predicted TIM-barrel fold metal-dependent hydrolase